MDGEAEGPPADEMIVDGLPSFQTGALQQHPLIGLRDPQCRADLGTIASGHVAQCCIGWQAILPRRTERRSIGWKGGHESWVHPSNVRLCRVSQPWIRVKGERLDGRGQLSPRMDP